MRIRAVGVIVLLALIVSGSDAAAQYAELSGRVVDETGGVIGSAIVSVVSKAKGLKRETTTNDQGIYALPALQPDEYVVRIQAAGFQTASRDRVILEVDQRAQLDFTLQVGTIETEVEVTGDPLRSSDGSVGTVIDRKFAASLPVNGRTFGTLLALAPGVTPAVTNVDGGQYSVNGQRSASNYLMVDGVAANVGLGGGTGRDSAAGQRTSSTITGGLNGLVSMDALQEIRIQTSSFSPEFGRTPGGQISLVTRSGTNVFHGSGFEQFRDEALAANNWFLNSRGIKKSKLDQHQFGGTLGGPIVRNQAFFFASYEGLRLLQPTALITSVPSLEARQQQSPVRELFESYPTPTGPSRADGSAEYATSVSKETTTDTWGLRVDKTLWAGAQAFARYSHAPSSARDDRVLFTLTPKTVSRSITGGITSTLGSRMLADFRFTYGNDEFRETQTASGPLLRASFFPSTLPSTTYVQFNPGILSPIFDGVVTTNTASQWNVVGSISHLFGAHHIKTGLDYKRVTPFVHAAEDRVAVFFLNVAQALSGNVFLMSVEHRFPVRGAFDVVSWYLQDTWKAASRLSLSYGFRGDINPAPSFPDNQGPLAASIGSATSVRLLPERNVPLWKTRYDDIAPRVGFSYALDADARLTLSGGFGLFGDLSGQAASLAFSPFTVPNGTSVRLTNVPMPLTPASVQGLAVPIVSPPFSADADVVDPNLRMPRTSQWNLSVERAIGGNQSVSVAYVGARGHRLLQTKGYRNLNSDFPGNVLITSSTGRSTYQSLQLEYRRRAAKGLQVLTSYTLGKSRDTASATLALDRQSELAPSSFDIRHVFNAAASWDLPSVGDRPLLWALKDWSVHVIGTARSGAPFTVTASSVFMPGDLVFARASLVPGEPIVLKDATAPGGQRLNRAAFTAPAPGEHGNTSRNGFRGLAAYQVDMGLQRSFHLPQNLRLHWRVDAFNVLNTPSFGLPVASLSDAQFGVPTATLNEAGGFSSINSLYRSGGSRVVELSVRLDF